MEKTGILSIGTMYVDINCVNFEFGKGLFVNKETVGDSYELELGGSALNFAKNASILGLESHFIGKMGNDVMGSNLLTLLAHSNIIPAVAFDSTVQTNVAIHYIREDGSSIMTSSGSANQSITIKEIEQQLAKHIANIDYLYLGGVFKMKNLLPHYPELLHSAKKDNVTVILDHGRINNTVTKNDIHNLHAIFPYIDIYLPSEDEFLTLWESKTLDEGHRRMKQIADPLTVIKQAEDGATGFKDGKAYSVKSYKVKAINTVGAGDSFNAGFIKAHATGKAFEDAMQYACAVAATKISHRGDLNKEKAEKLFFSQP